MAYSNKDIVSGGGAYSLVQELGKQFDNSISIQENSTKWLTLENNNLGINTTLTSKPIINTTSGSTQWSSYDRDNSGNYVPETSFRNCFGKLYGGYSWDTAWAALATTVKSMTPSGLVDFTTAWGYGTYSNTEVSSNAEYRSFTLSRVYSDSSSNSYYLIGLKLKDAYLLFYAQENNSTDATYTVPPIEDFTYIKDLSGKKIYGYFNTIIESGAKPGPVPIDATITTDHILRTEPETLEVYDSDGKLRVSETKITEMIEASIPEASDTAWSSITRKPFDSVDTASYLLVDTNKKLTTATKWSTTDNSSSASNVSGSLSSSALASGTLSNIMSTWCGATATETDTWQKYFPALTSDRASIYSRTNNFNGAVNNLTSYKIAYWGSGSSYYFCYIPNKNEGSQFSPFIKYSISNATTIVRDKTSGSMVVYIYFITAENVDKYDAGLVTGPSKLLLSDQVLGQDVNIDLKTGKLTVKTPPVSWEDIIDKPDTNAGGGTSLEVKQFNWDLNIPVSSADLSYGGYTFTIPNITEFQTFIESFGHTFGNPLIYFCFSGSINNNAIMTIASSSFYNSNIGVCSIGSLVNEFKNSDKLCTYDAHPSFFYQKDSGLIFQIDEYSIYKDTSKTTPSVSVIKTPITQLQGSLSILVIK